MRPRPSSTQGWTRTLTPESLPIFCRISGGGAGGLGSLSVESLGLSLSGTGVPGGESVTDPPASGLACPVSRSSRQPPQLRPDDRACSGGRGIPLILYVV